MLAAILLAPTLALLPNVGNANDLPSSIAEQARAILDATGIKGGLIAHLGCGDGKLTAALRANDSYLVHGLDADWTNVEKAREHIRSLGLYGKVSVDRFAGKHLPYTDNLVNLVVAESLGEVAIDEVLRVLTPNGVAYVKRDASAGSTIVKWLAALAARDRSLSSARTAELVSISNAENV